MKIKLSKAVLAAVDARAELRLKQEEQARIKREEAHLARLKKEGIKMLVSFGAIQRDTTDPSDSGNVIKFNRHGVPVSFSEYAGLSTDLFMMGQGTDRVYWEQYFAPGFPPEYCAPVFRALNWDILPIWGHVPDGEYLVKVAGKYRRAVKDGLTVIVHPHKPSSK